MDQLTKYRQALEKIASLSEVREMRGGIADCLGVPNHLVHDGWVPIPPMVKVGLDYAANIARKALNENQQET